MIFGIFLNLKNLRRSNIKQLNKKYLFRVTGDRINLQNGKLRGTRRKLYKIHTRASSNGRVPVPETRCVKKKKKEIICSACAEMKNSSAMRRVSC